MLFVCFKSNTIKELQNNSVSNKLCANHFSRVKFGAASTRVALFARQLFYAAG